MEEINGKKIKTLSEVSTAFSTVSESYVIKLIGVGRPIVLERTAVEAARDRILSRYNVSKEQNLSE